MNSHDSGTSYYGIRVADIDIEWDMTHGICTFAKLPVAMMWIDSTLAGLMSGVQTMVGTERFALALQSEGRKSIEDDWQVIARFPTFEEGFQAVAVVAAVAGWGEWSIVKRDATAKQCCIRVRNSWEGLSQKALGVCWGSAMLAGKMAGYRSKLYGENCWAEQTSFIARGDAYDEFTVAPSTRSLEQELDLLLASDVATRADMSVALQTLQNEIAQRRKSEQALLQHHELLTNIIESAPVRVFWKDYELRYLGCNHLFARDAGLSSPDELIGKTDFDMGWKDQAELYRADDRLVMETGAAKLAYEEPQTTPDGQTIWLRTSKVPLRDGENHVIGILGIYEDITEHKNRETQYRTIVETTTDGFWRVSTTDARLLEVNDIYCQMSGYSREELLTMRIPDIEAMMDEATAFEKIADVIARGSAIFETRHRHKDGSAFDVEINVNYSPIMGGTFFVFCRDISARKQFEHQLSESENRFRSMIEQSPLATQMVALDGSITMVNKAWENLWGVPFAALAGYNLLKDQQLSASGLMPLLESALAGHAISVPEMEYDRSATPEVSGASGKLWVRTFIYPLRDDQGKVHELILVQEDTSKRKQDEERIRLYQEIFALSNDAIAIIRPNGTYLEQNHAHREMLGFSDDELEGKTPAIHLGEEVFETVANILLATGQYNGEVASRACDGTRRIIDLSAFPIRNSKGDVECYVGIKRDITERKRDEEALRNSEQKLNAILDNVDAYIYLKDTEGRYLFANRLVRELWGADITDIVGFGDEKFFDEKTTENIRRNDRRVLINGETVRSEEANTVPSTGETKTYLSTKLPLYRDDGTISALCGISTDISERIKSETALQESEQRFRDLFEKSPDPCWIINEDNLFIICNQAAADILGYDSIEELTSTHPSRLSPRMQPDGRESFEKANAMMAAAHTTGVHRFEWIHKRKHGELFPVEVTLARIEIDGKQQLYCIWRDISERKQTEMALLESNSHTESLLRLSRSLEFARDDQQAIDAVATEVEAIIGYKTTTLFIIDDDGKNATMLSAHPSKAVKSMEPIRQIRIGDNRLFAESIAADGPVIVSNCQTDPRTDKELVAKMNARSIVHVPIRQAERCKALLGVATFGDEGELHPSQPQLKYLSSVANQLGSTLNRIDLERLRHEAEEKLRLSEERFQLAMEGANDGLWDWNLETDEVYYSQRWFSMLGYAPDVFPPRLDTWAQLVHDEDRERVLTCAADYLEGRADSFEVEVRMQHRDGHIVYILARARKVCNADGKPVRLVGTHVDISDHKRSEATLAESEAALKEAQRISHLGSWHIDLTSHEVYWSEELYRMYGFDTSQPPPHLDESMALFTPESRELLSATIARTIEQGGNYTLELEMTPKAGGTRWMQARGELVQDEHGHPLKLQGTAVDITERKQNELQLHQMLSLHEATLEATADGILVVDRDGKWSAFNQKFVHMWHIPEAMIASGDDQKVLNYVLNQLAHPQAFIDKVMQLYAHPEAISFDMLEFKDGRVFERYSMEQRLEGEIVGRVWSFRDVSDRHQAEERLRASEARLRIAMETAEQGWIDLHIPTGKTTVSPEIPKMLGYDPAEYVAGLEVLATSLHPDDKLETLAILDRCIRSTGHEQHEYRRKTKSGEWKWVNTVIRVIERDERGNAIRLIGVQTDISKRKQAETILMQSEERLKMAQTIGLVGIWDWAPQTGALIWTEETFNIFGYAMDEVVPSYELFLEHIISEDRNRLSEAVASALQAGTKYDIDCTFVRKDETRGYANAQGQVIFSDDGTPVRMIGTFQDITLRKKAELALRQELDFRSHLFEHASEGIVLWQPEHNGKFAEFIAWNRRMQEITGYTIEEINQAGWLNTIYRDDREREKARGTMSNVLAGNINRGTDFEITTRAGEARTIHISSSRVQTSDDAPLVLAVIQDITESKRAEKELRQAKFVMENAPFNITFLDEQANIHYLNKTARETFGLTEEQVRDGLKLSDIDPGATDEIWRAHWQELTQKKRIFLEREHQRKNGETFPVEIIANYMQFGDEAFNAAFDRDVSVQKQLEEQLRQSQKMEAIGTLVGGIAHDFNNMLAAIQGNLYLARNQMRSHPVADDKLANIEQLGNRAADMVQQLLTFARKDSVQMRTLQLNPFFREAFKLARTAIPENISQETEICSEQLYIHGDPTQLQQVIMNLLNNAVDAVAKAQLPCIECVLAPFEADESFRNMHPELHQQQFARITVRDNGSGIPEHLLSNIFEPFFSTKEIGKGTGLGLAMVYGAIRTHGGAITVDSQPGLGTRFDIYLPLVTTSEEEPDAPPEMVSGGRGECILLVDDDESVRKTTAEVLESMGYQVIQAVDGEYAMDYLQANRNLIRLVITDIVMPRMGGIALLQAIRQQDALLPVLLSTGYDKTHVLETHVDLQHCQQITKPFNFDHLALIVRELLDEHS
ncbi:PAS domain S-box protein [Mariprofundus erugo]|uniref:PAS domain S-box protein n=1 Tax=Mariprofundus erugo TaxID=2528639 RepID=UPI0010FEAF9A|nr:PAS domain S-box protein [Mariprofundus erugo]TLS77135.1 PAS domain S-box protein [Mariprofundus erugo]